MTAGRWPWVAGALLASFLACAPRARTQEAGAAPAPDAGKPIPADLRGQVQRAEHIGPMIYQLDHAAEVAGDALGLNESSPLVPLLGGYLAVEETDEEDRSQPAFDVLFYSKDSEPRVLFMVRVPTSVNDEPTVKKFEPPAPTDESVRRLIRARRTALAALKEPEQVINPVVLPGSLIGEKGDVLVYLLAATTRPKTAVFGRHYRVLVSADGNTVKRFEPLSRSVLEMSTEMPEKALGLFVTHLVTPVPLETHVFTSLLLKRPVYVGTSRGLWRISEGRIELVQEEVPKISEPEP